MSRIRIAIGLLTGLCFLAADLAAFWYFNLPVKWIPISLCGLGALVGGLMVETQRRKALRPYWERACTGICWKRRFPDASKAEIREFLDLFVNAFAFHPQRRLCFFPDDHVMEIYRALYPENWTADSLELETFASLLRETYGLELNACRDDITLGELFDLTRT